MTSFADFSICGYKPLYYPVKGVSKTWDIFWRYVIDIPEYPISGSITGNDHWELIDADTKKRKVVFKLEVDDASDFIDKLTNTCNEHSYKAIFSRQDENNKLRVIFTFPDKDNIDDIIGTIESIGGRLQNRDKLKIVETTEKLYRDKSTGIVYEGPENDNTAGWLRVKGALITLAMPIYFVSTIAYKFLKIIPTILFLIGDTFYQYFSQKGENQRTFIAIVLTQTGKIFYQTYASIRDIIRTPFFAFEMTKGAVWAIFSPFNGMKIIGSSEHHWNHRKSKFSEGIYNTRKFSFRHFFENGAYLLAPCMSPRGVSKFNEDGTLGDEIYAVPDDITDFKWNELKVMAQITTAEKTQRMAEKQVCCCCFIG